MIEYIIERNPDMVFADQLNGIVNMIGKGFGAVVIMSQEHPDARDADDAAADRAGAHQIIGDIARLITYRARVGVRDDDRRAGKVDGFPRGAVARMRAADHHPDPVHDRNGPAAEIDEAARILAATTTPR